MWDYIFYLLLIKADGTFISKNHTIVFFKDFQSNIKKWDFLGFLDKNKQTQPNRYRKSGYLTHKDTKPQPHIDLAR